MLELIIGRSGTGKSRLLLRRICAQKGERCVLLVPESRSHETERRLCAAAGGHTGPETEVLTFSRLAARVFQTAGGCAREELDQGGRVLLMHRAVQAVSGELKVYARPSRRPAFLKGLLDTVDELKSSCVTPEQLTAAGQEIGGRDGDRLCDLGLICAAYAALTARIALDPRDRLTRAAEKLAECGWAQGVRFYLDGFVDFTPQQLQIIRLLLQQGEGVTVALTCDHLEEDEGGTGIFSPARQTAARLSRMAAALGQERCVETCDRPSPGRSKAMGAVEQYLFGALPGEKLTCGEDVQLFRAPDARAEVEWTAAKILELVRGGLRYRDVGVAVRGYERYDALVESVFAQYGIPVFRSAMSDVMRKPVLTLITAALDAVTGGYTYDDVFRYLKTDLTGLEREDRDLLENYVLRWDVRGSRWTHDAPWAMHPRGYGNEWKDEDRVLLTRMDKARRAVVAPLERLRHNPDRTGEGQAKALYRFLEEIELSRRLEERCALLREQGELGLAEEYRQLWGILCAALEQCAALLEDAPMELEEFAKLLRLVLSQSDVGTIPVSLDRVTAGELTRRSGHGIQALFLLGADDGSIPGEGASAGLLTDEDRELLSGVGVELGMRGEERLHRELTAVYTACTCPERKLFVTWPASSGGKEAACPCFAVKRLQAIFSDLTVQGEGDGAFRLAAPRPALEQAGRWEAARLALEQLPQWQEAALRLERMEQWQRGRLSAEIARRLYGAKVRLSASKLDQYKSCHFKYFMNYGLAAEPRAEGAFSAPEYGTFVHDVLEHVIAADGWRGEDGAVDADALRRLTGEAVERYVREKMGGLEQQSARFRYLFRRLVAGVDEIVTNVAEELAASRFVPLAFELGFGENKTLPPVKESHGGVEINLRGYVDRVDGLERDGKLYLRVVDYKTGKKIFDLTDVSSGMGLQMLLYLFALREEGKALFGREIVPAGVLYLPARTATVSGSRNMSEEERQKAADKQLRRNGLLLDEPEVLDAMEQPGEKGYRFLPLDSRSRRAAVASARRFERLERHVRRILQDVCDEFAEGNITADPYWRGSANNACRYCNYAAACHFEPGRGGDCQRRLAGVDAEEFWARLEREDEVQNEEVSDRA